MTGNLLYRLGCSSCAYSELCGPQEMLRHLQRLGMMRRVEEPEPEEIAELLTASAGRLTCPECGGEGLTATPHDEEEGDWGEIRPCQLCGQPIPNERLELFPDSEYCAACQSKADAGGGPDEREFCPHCGDVLQLRQRHRGLTRYALICPSCGR